MGGGYTFVEGCERSLPRSFRIIFKLNFKSIFMAAKDAIKVYELVLNGPGMTDSFKLSFTVSRRHLLMICLLIENGINPGKERAEELTGLLSKEMATELGVLIPEILKKGGPGLFEFYEKLKTL
jgi:hypothetical protein